jgi:2-(1,2-epoxy-1,2-dihydrophenyl)acetyl-CoA isomerase
MPYSSIIFEVKDNIGLIRLNRPEEGNTLTMEMVRELLAVASRCDEDPEVRAVVLTGSGRMFCVGGDMKAFLAQGERVSVYIKELTQILHAAISRFNWMDAPVV